MLLEKTEPQRHASRVQEEKISLINILTCLICTNKARHAHICPNCSKFYCEFCIKDWLANGDGCCPNCKRQISASSLVNCNKLSQDLSSALEALIQFEAPTESSCSSHQLALSYYCKECEGPLCSDCIVLGESHMGHTFVKIKKVKVEFSEKILCLLSKLRNKKKDIEKLRDHTISLSNNGQLKAKIEKLNHHGLKLKDNYQLQSSSTLEKFEDQIANEAITNKIRNKSYESILSCLQELNKVKLVRKATSEMQDIILASIQDLSVVCSEKQRNLKKVREAIESNIAPNYTHKTFILDNYSHFREKKDVIYSDSFYDGMNEWRLKIYPSGLESPEPAKKGLQQAPSSPRFRLFTKKEEYISIYLELKSGARSPGCYMHEIQIVNQLEPRKLISQRYESSFEIGECWGYDHFAKISTLYQDGYVHPKEDSLQIVVSVRPPSFFHSCEDLNALIKKKETRVSTNKELIKRLKHELGFNRKERENVEDNYYDDVEIKTKPSLDEEIKLLREWKVSFEEYGVVGRKSENKCGEEADPQSSELRKIWRRVGRCQDRDLLIF